MEILTDATLSKLLAECAKYENYIGAILFESRDREAEFLNEIKSLGNDWTINVRLGRIKCKNNNSHIYTFTINRNFEEKIRGMEFNSMLLDGACGADDVVVYIYGQSLVKYISTQNVEEMTTKTSDTALIKNRGGTDVVMDVNGCRRIDRIALFQCEWLVCLHYYMLALTCLHV